MKTNSVTMDYIREVRNKLLASSDVITLIDDISEQTKEAWLTYRQALRDLPSTLKTPEEVVWPEKPQ
jgi:hypothetical protein